MAPLLFVVIGLVAGAVLKSLLKHSSLPYTVCLFCLGVVFGLLSRFNVLPDVGVLRSAVDAVANMDPDLILYVFLPLLIFDGAYEMDLHVYRKS